MRRQFSFQYPIRAALWSSLPLNIVEWSPFITAGPVQEGLQCIIRFYFHMIVASVLRYSGTNTDRGQVWAHSIRVLHSAEIFNIFGSNTHNMPLLKGPTWVIWSLPALRRLPTTAHCCCGRLVASRLCPIVPPHRCVCIGFITNVFYFIDMRPYLILFCNSPVCTVIIPHCTWLNHLTPIIMKSNVIFFFINFTQHSCLVRGTRILCAAC